MSPGVLLGIAGAALLATRRRGASPRPTGPGIWGALPEKLFDAQDELYDAVVDRGSWDSFFPVTTSRAGPDGRRVAVTVFVTNAVQLDGVRVSNLVYPYAQRFADRFGLLLPTPRIADMVHEAAQQPGGVHWGAEKVYIPLAKVITNGCPVKNGKPVVCNNTTKTSTLAWSSVCDKLAAGRAGLADNEGKWFVLSLAVFEDPTRSGIYGWWRSNGELVQSYVPAHELYFGDYEQAWRFVGPTVVIEPEGEAPFEMATKDVYTSVTWAFLLSAEGPLPGYRHPGVPEEEGLA